MQEDMDPTKWGWQLSNVEGAMVPTPIWDLDDNVKKIDILRQPIMHKCSCK